VRYLGLASLLVTLCLPVASKADDNITLELPAFPKQESQRVLEAPIEAPAAKPKPNPAAELPTAPNRHVSTIREKVVGRLGVAARPSQIKASRSSKGRTLAKVQAGTYLALSRETDTHYGILMSDKTLGWMRKQDVNVLDYEVTVKEQPVERSQLAYANRGGSSTITSSQQAVLQEAYKYLGVPYKYGGTSTSNGIDCSAFVQRCFSTVGIGLPRTAHEQFNVGMPVSADNLESGDRLYFAGRGGSISHTGIYISNGFFIHASSSNHGVAVSRLTDPMYAKMFAGARR
jgi:cell wall-associated NlpC family hydrolase